MLKGEELTAGAVVSASAWGTVFLTCLMETGPVAGVGFSLMAESIAPSPHVRKGNFGKVVPRGRRVCGRKVLENGIDLCNARGWDINSAADPTWAKRLGFVYRVTVAGAFAPIAIT